MKKILIPMIAVSALAATTVPALAQPMRADSWQSINQRQANLDRRIDMGIRNHSLTRNEAIRLRGEFRQIVRLEANYRRGGLNAWERQDLDRRFDRLSAQIRIERRDRDYGYGYGHDYNRR